VFEEYKHNWIVEVEIILPSISEGFVDELHDLMGQFIKASKSFIAH
jgi:hypothetical protein